MGSGLENNRPSGTTCSSSIGTISMAKVTLLILVSLVVLFNLICGYYYAGIVSTDIFSEFVPSRNGGQSSLTASNAAPMESLLDNNETSPCLSIECLSLVAQTLARAYPDKDNQSDWIITSKSNYNVTQSNYTHAGIIYVKNFKAASTTAAGVALRIAHLHGETTQSSQRIPAWVKFSHVRGHKYSLRDPKRSFLFTSVRDPASRALSRIFYTSITQKGESPSDSNLLQKLRWSHRQYGAVAHEGGGYQVRYVTMQKHLNTSWTNEYPDQVVNPWQVRQNVREIIQNYDFIMLAERMDESVVVLALLTGLDLSDVLVMDSKRNKGQQYLYFSKHDKHKGMVEECKLSVKAFRSSAVQAHLQSTEWLAKNYGDYLLHAAANHSLDLTIDRLGQLRVDKALAVYRYLKNLANSLCSASTVYHCSSEGYIQRNLSKLNCYSDDSGCGYPCIDDMLSRGENSNQSKASLRRGSGNVLW